MATKALTTVLVVQPVSTASLTSIPYGLILADANRFIRRDGNAVVHVVQPARHAADNCVRSHLITHYPQALAKSEHIEVK
jgi:hypothetical protein